jgi:hypothetical protein
MKDKLIIAFKEGVINATDYRNFSNNSELFFFTWHEIGIKKSISKTERMFINRKLLSGYTIEMGSLEELITKKEYKELKSLFENKEKQLRILEKIESDKDSEERLNELLS